MADILNTDGDQIVSRNEATAAKGQDPRQTLNTGMACGLGMDDVLAYVGLYLGDGSISKYQGDLDDFVKDNMLEFSRTWQPGTDALACQYRGGCDNNTPTPVPGSNPGSSSDFVFGLESNGTLYHLNGGHTGGFVYLCIDGTCHSATLRGNRWEAGTGITSGSHNLEFKIQDNTIGQCVATAAGVNAGFGVDSSPCY